MLKRKKHLLSLALALVFALALAPAGFAGETPEPPPQTGGEAAEAAPVQDDGLTADDDGLVAAASPYACTVAQTNYPSGKAANSIILAFSMPGGAFVAPSQIEFIVETASGSTLNFTIPVNAPDDVPTAAVPGDTLPGDYSFTYPSGGRCFPAFRYLHHPVRG